MQHKQINNIQGPKKTIKGEGLLNKFKLTGFHHKVALAGLIIGLVIVGRGAFGMFQKYSKVQQKIKEARAQLDTLKDQEKFLRSEIERLSSNRGVEQELRERFGVAKEGEDVVVIVDDKKGESNGQDTKAVGDQAAGSWFSKIFSIFRKK